MNEINRKKSIVLIQPNLEAFDNQHDYFVKRSIRFQKYLETYGIEGNGFLLQHTNNNFTLTGTHPNHNTRIHLIVSQPISIKLFQKISTFLNNQNIEVLGCVLDHKEISYKSLLHPSLDSKEVLPKWYEEASDDLNSAIPGYTSFTKDSAYRSYKELKKAFPRDSIRLKLGNGYNGVNQYTVKTVRELKKKLEKIFDGNEIINSGLVLEVDVQNKVVYGLTRLSIGEKTIYTKGEQYFRNNIYIGTSLTDASENLDFKDAELLEKTANKYSNFADQLNRFNMDIIKGELNNGQKVEGVIDLSLRPGAATFLELEYLNSRKKKSIYQLYSDKIITNSRIKTIQRELKKYGDSISIDTSSKFVVSLIYDQQHITFEDMNALVTTIYEKLQLDMTLSSDLFNHKRFKTIKDIETFLFSIVKKNIKPLKN